METVTLCTLLHGAGSTPAFIERAFGRTVAQSAGRILAPDVTGMTLEQMIALIEEISPQPGDLIGGVSLGAHAATAFAARTGWSGELYVVMPAWVGAASAVAALNLATADEIAAHGSESVLSRLEAQLGRDWVLSELRSAWSGMSETRLIDTLRSAARQPAPTREELASVRANTTIVALADDPTHPLSAAEQWHECIAQSSLTVLPRDLAGLGPSALAGPLRKVLSGFQ